MSQKSPSSNIPSIPPKDGSNKDMDDSTLSPITHELKKPSPVKQIKSARISQLKQPPPHLQSMARKKDQEDDW